MNNLLELLQAQTGGDEEQDGFTTKEVMKLLECGEDTARERIRGLLESGQAETLRVKRKNMAGILTTVIGYRLIE